MTEEKSWDSQTHQEKAERVLNFLNRLTGQTFKALNPAGKPTANCKLVIERIKDGYSRDDFEKVIRTRNAEWSGDDKMAKYLRPSTLFRKSNFEQYLATQEIRRGIKSANNTAPNIYDVVEEWLADYQRRGGLWAYGMDKSPVKASSWWINEMQEPARKGELPYQEEGSSRWRTPHIDRVMANLKKYLVMGTGAQAFIVGAIQDGVPWRGDDIPMYQRIYDEHMHMLEQADPVAYRKAAKVAAKDVIKRMD